MYIYHIIVFICAYIDVMLMYVHNLYIINVYVSCILS